MLEFLRDLKTFTLPWTTKAVVIGLLAAAMGLNLAIFVFAWITRHNDLIASTLQFFGTILPIVVVVTLLARADTGVTALQRRTENLFSRVLPNTLSRIGEQPGPFYAPNPRRPPPESGLSGRVFVNLRHGDCHADILVFTPCTGGWTAMLLRLEINVLRVNFNLCIPRVLVGRSKTSLAARFKHTLGGAAAGSDHKDAAATHSGYHFLTSDLVRTVDGLECVCLVGSKFVGEEFLWNSAQQLYFGQDLMFMLRAFLTEAPQLFPTFVGPEPTGFESLKTALAERPKAGRQ